MDDVELVRQKIDIGEFISEYVSLKRSGKHYKALCPFHSEKTPSFMVSPERQTWHCFGCSLGGDVFSFLMHIERMEFPEALRSLAARAGVPLHTHMRTTQPGLKEKILSLNHLAETFYHHILLTHTAAEPCRNYLSKRGVSTDSIVRFRLGYAPNTWDALIRFLTKKGFAQEELLKAGMASRGRESAFDLFRGRLMFPLHDHHGNTIGFAGRTLGSDTPKYMNTPETPVFVKGNFLYGLDLSKHAIRSSHRALLMEGELDLILAWQAGTHHAVAIKGTALTEAQISLIKRYAETIDLCFDPDIAGSNAALRGIERAHARELSVHIVNLPKGDDPSSLIQKDTEQWRKSIAQPVAIYDYWIDTILAQIPHTEAHGKRRVAATLAPVLAGITDPVMQSHYIQKLTALLAVEEAAVRRVLSAKGTAIRSTVENAAYDNEARFTLRVNPQEKREEHYLGLLLQSDAVGAREIGGLTAEEFNQAAHQELFRLIAAGLSRYNDPRRVRLATVLTHLSPHLESLVARLQMLEVAPDGWTEKEYMDSIAKARVVLLKTALKEKLHALRLEMRAAEMQGDSEVAHSIEAAMKEAVSKLAHINGTHST